MALYTNALAVYFNGEYRRIKAGDVIEIGGAGKFKAAQFEGDLIGNADTASAWASPVEIAFSGGDVSGTVTGLDGSGNVSGVALTLASITTASTKGSASQVAVVTRDDKGRVTSLTETDIEILHSQVSDWDTTINGYGFLTGADISGKVDKTQQVIAGTGLAGGGDFQLGDVTLSLGTSGVTAQTNYGSASEYLQVSVDQYGRVTSLSKGNIQIGIGQVTDLQDSLDDKADAANPTFTGTATFDAVHVNGDLTVTGDIYSAGQSNITAKDAFIDMRVGGSVGDYQAGAGGFVVNVNVAEDSDIAPTAFVAASGGTRAYAEFAAGTNFVGDYAAGALVQISSSTDNDGFYAVYSVDNVAKRVYLMGPSDDTSAAPFLHNVLNSDPAPAGACRVSCVFLSAIAVSSGSLSSYTGVIPAGKPCYASGRVLADFSASLVDHIPGWTTLDSTDPVTVGSATAGDVLALDNSGYGQKATNVVSAGLYDVALVALGSTSSPASMSVHSAIGKPVRIMLDAVSASAGQMVYLGTNGKGILTAPDASGTAVVEIGRAAQASAADYSTIVWFRPKVKIVNT